MSQVTEYEPAHAFRQGAALLAPVPGLPVELAAAATAARQRLAVGRDVVVLGGARSGRSTVISQVVAQLNAGGVNIVCLGAVDVDAGSRLASLNAHPLVATLPPSARPRDLAALAQIFEAELQGPRNLLAIDDVDRLDESTMALVDRLLRLPSVRLLATAHLDLHARWDCPARQLVAARPTSEVRLHALGFRGMARLVERRLGAHADAALTSALLARSAGNPGAAAALLDAARWSGGLAQVKDIWVEARPLAVVPTDALVHALVGRLPGDLVAPLETLAWTGPLALTDAIDLVGEDALEALGQHERIAVFPTGRGDTVAVSPPALGETLRDRVAPVRRHLLARRTALVTQRGEHDGLNRDFVRRLLQRGTPGEARAGAAHDRVALVHQQALAADGVRWAEWAAEPSVAHALAYIDGLVTHPRAEQMVDIFGRSPIGPDEPPREVARFRMRQAEWMLSQHDELGHTTGLLRQWADQLGAEGRVLDTQADLFELTRGHGALVGRPLDPDSARLVHGDSAPLVHALASTFVERGQPELALDLLDDAAAQGPGSPQARHLEDARADTMLLLDRSENAEYWARAMLEDAYASSDARGIRMHSLRLAEILYLVGDRAAAWRVLSVSLRLGPPSPFGVSSYDRALALGAVLRAESGDTALARELEAELSSRPRTYRPTLDALRHCAAAAILYAEGRPAEADALLWDAGCTAVDAGHHASALLCWTSRHSAYPRDQVARLVEVLEASTLPIFEPVVRLHQALTDGTEHVLAEALRNAGRLAFDEVALAALAGIDVARTRRSRPLLTPAEKRELAPFLAAVQAQDSRGVEPDAADLTPREAEIATMAQAGLTNRQIAARLSISVRTAENHMHNILRKLGLLGRAELATWVPPRDLVSPPELSI